MKIVSCFLDRDEIAPLIKAGAAELYTGVAGVPSFTGACRYSPGEMKPVFSRIRSLGGRALVAANSLRVDLPEKKLEELVRHLFELEEAGADGFIVSSPALLTLLRGGRKKLKADIHLSSVQPCLNSGALRFFLRFGISRLILPNSLTPAGAAEILRACRRAGVETEIFDYRFFCCPYLNGRCRLHKDTFYTRGPAFSEGAACRPAGEGGPVPLKPFAIRPGQESRIPAIARRLSARIGGGTMPRAVNAAAFWDYFRMGVGYLKFGLRTAPAGEKTGKVAAARRMADLAETLLSELGPEAGRREFIRRMSSWA